MHRNRSRSFYNRTDLSEINISISSNSEIINIFEDAFINTKIKTIDFSNVAMTTILTITKHIFTRTEMPKKLKLILPFYI